MPRMVALASSRHNQKNERTEPAGCRRYQGKTAEVQIAILAARKAPVESFIPRRDRFIQDVADACNRYLHERVW